MVNLAKLDDSAVKFTFTDSQHYLTGNGEITVPLNSLILVLDESNMATFKKVDGDPFISFLISESNFSSKADLEAFYKENMVGGGGVDPEEVVDIVASGTSYYDGVEYDSVNSRINFKHGNTIEGYIDAAPFIVDGMVDNVAISGGNLVITFNTDSGKQPISIPLTDIFDPSNYYDKTAIDTIISGVNDSIIEDEEVISSALNDLNERKLDASAYTPTDLSNYYNKTEVNGLLADKQDELSAGTNISIVNDTIRCTLPISAGTGSNSIIIGYRNPGTSWDPKAGGSGALASGPHSSASAEGTFAFGYWCEAQAKYSFAQGYMTYASNEHSHAEGQGTHTVGKYSHAEGLNTSAKTDASHTEGSYTVALNRSEHAEGEYNNSVKASNTFGDSGNTLFSVGNGTAENARHNAFEIRQNGDIYITKNGADVKLQDQLGGGSASSAITSGDTNAVQGGAVYDKFDEVESVTAAALNNLNNKFGGLSLVKLTQAEYNALTTKDNNTLYVIVD